MRTTGSVLESLEDRKKRNWSPPAGGDAFSRKCDGRRCHASQDGVTLSDVRLSLIVTCTSLPVTIIGHSK
eukprot:1330461-Amorphochlora_amoeboformis.AAC.1